MADAPIMSGERPVISVSPTLRSNINWVNVVSFVVAGAAMLGYVIPEQYSRLTVEILVLATPLVTLLFRNFWKGSVPTVTEIKVLAEDKGMVIAPFKTVTAKVVTTKVAAKAKPKK